jgi:hypothetical protein
VQRHHGQRQVATPGPLALCAAMVSKVTCISNARIQLTTARGGLTDGAAPANSSYTKKIHYTAKASYNGATETLTTSDGTAAGFTTAGTTTAGGARERRPRHLARRPRDARRQCARQRHLHRHDHGDADAGDVKLIAPINEVRIRTYGSH